MSDAGRLHRVVQVAEATGTSVATIRRLIRAGDLPFVRLTKRAIRVADADLQQLIARRRVGRAAD